MLLYNGSDESSSQMDRTMSPNSNSGSQQMQLKGQEIHPSVEAFLTSAMKDARLPWSYGNMDNIPSSEDEESSIEKERQRTSSQGIWHRQQ
mmetsp:Transcript_23198/g.39655  ORF Transcript_23198/g.39655 Transcript_23198/m.39655 type:complete len:91 (-) Transcript_23198:573-845(-)